MKCVHLVSALVILQTCGVLCAPQENGFASQDNSVEQELIRHHHSTKGGKSNTDAQIADDTSLNQSEEPAADDNSIDTDANGVRAFEEGLYDITVGDVIYDVLLTLRDHPEIVKELIPNDDTQIGDDDTSSPGDNLAGFPSDQMNSEPKRVEKKAGRSGMQVQPDTPINPADKRQAELINDAFTDHNGGKNDAEPRDFINFINAPAEGGEDEEKFNYKQFISESESETSDDSSKTSDESTDHSTDDSKESYTESQSSESKINDYNLFRMPLISPLSQRYPNRVVWPFGGKFLNEGDAKNSKEKIWQKYKNKDSDSNSSDSSSENQLKWLLHKEKSKAKDIKDKAKNSGNM